MTTNLTMDDYQLRQIARLVDQDLYGQSLTEAMSAWSRAAAYTGELHDGRCNGTGVLYRAHWDSGHDDTYCPGCAACPAGHWSGRRDGRTLDAFLAARSVGRFIWRASRIYLLAQLDRAIGGFAALARVGAAVAAALSPGLGISRYLHGAVQNWATIVVGRWVTVTGRQGRAKAAHGMSGQVVDERDEDQVRAYFNRTITTGTTRVLCVQTTDGTRRWIPARQVSPMVAPAVEEAPVETIARKRAAALLVPALTFQCADAVVIEAERSRDGAAVEAGYRGRVFWTGNGRVGMKACAHRSRCKCPAVWVTNRQVVAATPANYGTDEGLASDTVEMIAVKLAELGRADVAEVWFQAIVPARSVAIPE